MINTHLPLIATHLEKRILDIFQLRANDLSTWLAMFSERMAAQVPVPPVLSPKVESAPSGIERHLRPEPKSRQGSFEDYIREDQSEHGTDQSTAYGEELRYQAEGNPAGARTREPRAYNNRPVPVKPTMVSVLVFAQNGIYGETKAVTMQKTCGSNSNLLFYVFGLFFS